MSRAVPLSLQTVHHVRDHCLCLHAQRAARALARRFDDALRPVGLTNGQFSLLMALSVPQPPPMTAVAMLLAMDRTTLTAALKPLERRGLVRVEPDEKDRRTRRLGLTGEGAGLLQEALPIWKKTHAEVERGLKPGRADALREDLLKLS